MDDQFPSRTGPNEPSATRRRVLGTIGTATVGLGLAGCLGSIRTRELNAPNVTYPSTDQHPLIGYDKTVRRQTAEFADQEAEVEVTVDFFAYDWSGSDFGVGTLLVPQTEIVDVPITGIGSTSIEQLVTSPESRRLLLAGLNVDADVAEATTDARRVHSRAVANPEIFAADEGEVVTETWVVTGEERAVLLDVAKGPLSFESVATETDTEAVFGTGVSKVYDATSAAATPDSDTPEDGEVDLGPYVEEDVSRVVEIHDDLQTGELEVVENPLEEVDTVSDPISTYVDDPTPTATPTPRKPGARTITGPPAPGMESFDEAIPALMDRWGIPGGVVGVVKDGELVFVHGYGQAVRASDPAASDSELVRPDSRFRIASLSKPITAVAVLDLVEQGRLALDDPAVDYLGNLLPSSGLQDSRVRDVTIRNLLRHTGGWDVKAIGWGPMFRPDTIANAEGTTPPAEPDTIIRYMFKRDLNFPPGEEYAYSNFGYCVLGRVIESVTGRGYEEHVSKAILEPMGIQDMTVGKTRSRAPNEVRYYGNGSEESVFPNEGQVRAPYGHFYLQAMDAHGGWVASVADVLRFLVHANGRGPVSDVLSSGTFDTMTDRPAIPRWQGEDSYYGMGLRVRPDSGNWWHTGSLPGTTAIAVRSGTDGLGWAALMNSRPPNWDGDDGFNRALDRTLWNAVEDVSDWPDRDLFSQFG